MPAPGAHGGDGARLASALGVDVGEILDLSVSLNPCAPHVADLVRAHADAVTRYPDPGPATAALAAAMHVDEANVVLTNGGSEAIALVAAERPCGDVDPFDFSLYARHLRWVDPTGPRWRSNPHNPTGRLAPRTEKAAVWDEAFYPLAAGEWTRRDFGAVVVGSLTKVFACPGLRAGYVLAPDARFAEAVRARRPEWSLNALAAAVLPELVAAANLPKWAVTIRHLRTVLAGVLRRHGLEPDPSDANYLLVRRAPGVRDHLGRAGVLVRDTGTFGIHGGVRIAVPDLDGIDRLADALPGLPRE
ncbi:MAG TPA: aminotransferase class I/II-fold pyridoxal phosphate-dependent enzyme [Acidimicrobiia bacterium]